MYGRMGGWAGWAGWAEWAGVHGHAVDLEAACGLVGLDDGHGDHLSVPTEHRAAGECVASTQADRVVIERRKGGVHRRAELATADLDTADGEAHAERHVADGHLAPREGVERRGAPPRTPSAARLRAEQKRLAGGGGHDACIELPSGHRVGRQPRAVDAAGHSVDGPSEAPLRRVHAPRTADG